MNKISIIIIDLYQKFLKNFINYLENFTNLCFLYLFLQIIILLIENI